MENDLCKKEYEEYISAMKELVEATEKARQYGSFVPSEPGEESSILTGNGRKAFQRLYKANEIYAEKYREWMVRQRVARRMINSGC